jgi:hypothetical protein
MSVPTADRDVELGDDDRRRAEWVEEATGGPSQDLNEAYGYLSWLGPISGPPGSSAFDAAAASRVVTEAFVGRAG